MLDLDYYDRILAGMATAVLAGTVVGVVTPIPLHTGVLAGALAATPLVYLALFRNPPLPDTSRTVKVGAVVWHLVVLFAVLEFLL